MRVTCAVRLSAATAACAAAVLIPAGAEAAESASQTLTSPGEHAFLVPAGVTSLHVTLVGGNGGAGFGGKAGGTPATVTATLLVSPGMSLYVEVAGDGQSASGSTNLGGYGGGGAGGERAFGGVGGGGGGGASDVRTCPAGSIPPACGGLSSFASRMVVAAGGGGGGGTGAAPASTAGGEGGSSDHSGAGGQEDAHGDAGGSGGQRGTSAAGGEPGAPSFACNEKTGIGCATAGQAGSGGAGGGAVAGGGGGGGGGLFGGGGGGGGAFKLIEGTTIANGGGGGGGGGASGVPATATGVSGFSLVPTATGAEPSAVISWTLPPPAASTEAASAVTATTATLNGKVNPDGSQVSDCHFTISPAPAAGALIPCPQQLGAASTPVAVSAPLTGLAPATVYTVTLVAASAQGSSSGSPVMFSTAPAGSGGPGAPGAANLGAAPSVTNLKLSSTRFRRGHKRATIARAKGIPTATTISFALSQDANVKLSFESAQQGVLVGHRCRAPSKAHRGGRRCTRYVAVPRGVTLAAHAGIDRISFDGVLDAGARLAPGDYRLTLGARTGAGATTATQHPTFTLLGP